MTPAQFANHLDAHPIADLTATRDGDALHLVCGRARVTLRPDPRDPQGAIADLPHIGNPERRLGRNRPDTVRDTLKIVVWYCLLAVKPTLGDSHDDLRKPGLYRDALRMYFDCRRGDAFGDGKPGLGKVLRAALASTDADIAAQGSA